jgi:hypothetical protein
MRDTVPVMAGFRLGDQWDEFGTYVGLVSKAVLAPAAIAVAGYVVMRVRGRNREQP